MPLDKSQEASPQMSNTSLYNYASPISPAQTSPPRFGIDFTVNNGIQHTRPVWTSNSNGHPNGSGNSTANAIAGNSVTGPEFYNSSQDPNIFTPTAIGGYPIEYDSNAMTGIASSVVGLPFHGLEYIRNYNGSNYMGEPDSLWQSYDPGAFYDSSDIPLIFGDVQHQSNDMGEIAR